MNIQQDQVNNIQPMYNSNPQMEQITAQMPIQQNSFRPVGPKSMEMICPNCRCRITTTVRHRSTAKTHISCLLLTGLCCCWLPYCMSSCKNANHFCPMCETFLGTYSS